MSYGTLAPNAYRVIRRKIVGGELRPGVQVSEQSLAEEIGVSRTPVREAIRRLRIEGLVDQLPRLGTIVRQPHRDEVEELYDALEALYAWVVHAAVRRIEQSDLDLMSRLCEQARSIAATLQGKPRAALDDEAVLQWLELDAAFYMIPTRAAGNSEIAKIVHDCRARIRLAASRLPELDLAAVARLYRLQGTLIRAMRRRDGVEAAAILSETIGFRRRLLTGLLGDDTEAVTRTALQDFIDELNLIEERFGEAPSAYDIPV